MRLVRDGPDLVHEGQEQARGVRLAATGVAREDEVAGPVGLARLEPAQAVNLDGPTEAAHLVLDGVEANDFG